MFWRKRETQPTPTSAIGDITVYRPVKHLGFLVADTSNVASEVYGAAGLVQPGESFVDLHLNPYEDKAGFDLPAVRRSLNLVADYMTLHPEEIPPQQMYGVTSPRLGRVALRFGFEETDIQYGKLPSAILHGVTGKMNGEVVAVQQSTQAFIDRFGSPTIDLGSYPMPSQHPSARPNMP